MAKKPMVIGFSYGTRDNDPGISNRDLIVALFDRHGHRFDRGSLILQHELAASMLDLCQLSGYMLAGTIDRHCTPGTYLDTHEVARQGVEQAVRSGATDLYILAYPFLHRPLCTAIVRRLAKPHGLPVSPLSTGWIRSDPQSTQWWTRSPLLLSYYATRRIVLGTRGT